MTPEDYERVRELASQAHELTMTKRAEFLHRECGSRVDLLREVESLLQFEAEKGGTRSLDGPSNRHRLDPGESVERRTPVEFIGPYRVLETLGEGGMGVVYLAEQKEPVRRRVALKVIKHGIDSEVLARFEAERQALAVLEHPGIASIYDAGETNDGRPYFVMEVVKGLPITDYCDRHKVSLRDRLELFGQVCDALGHAHHRGIIHRDLKPSNILVFAPDEKPVAKIIDFGVAKATNQRLTERTLYTELGKVVGTPAYMSPEQAELSGEGLDHRSDIYSLGVLLYELLVGELPIEVDLRSAALDEIVRRIRDDEPPAPSVRWTRLAVSVRTEELATGRVLRTPRTFYRETPGRPRLGRR